MLKLVLRTAFALLVVANMAFFFTPQAATSSDAFGASKSCGCADGSDPDGPEPPYEDICIEWLYDQCESAEQCDSCEEN